MSLVMKNGMKYKKTRMGKWQTNGNNNGHKCQQLCKRKWSKQEKRAAPLKTFQPKKCGKRFIPIYYCLLPRSIEDIRNASFFSDISVLLI